MRTRVVLTSGGEEPVLDQGGGQNSVFTKALLEVLRQNTGILAGIDLFSAIRTEMMLNAAQTPVYGDLRDAGGHDGGDFLFVTKP